MGDELIESQRRYYDERAPDYGDVSRPSDRRGRGLLTADMVRAIIDELQPTGDVLELACGPGVFTGDIARHADSVTAVDASPRMLEIARSRVGDEKVTFVCADVFDLIPALPPDRRYDVVFFGCWLSHVPPASFEVFLDLVARCLAPGGRMAFEDEDHRGAVNDDVRDVDGVPVASRRLADGRRFDVVKVFWRPDELASRLASLGWDADVRSIADTSLYGVATRAAPDRTG